MYVLSSLLVNKKESAFLEFIRNIETPVRICFPYCVRFLIDCVGTKIKSGRTSSEACGNGC